MNRYAKDQFLQEMMDPGNTSTSPFKSNTIKPIKSDQLEIKAKPSLPKKRYHESVVDMGQQIDDDASVNSNNVLGKMKFREPTFISKTRKYKEKIH